MKIYCDHERRQLYDGRIKVDYACHKAKMTRWRWRKLRQQAKTQLKKTKNTADAADDAADDENESLDVSEDVYEEDDDNWKGVRIQIN